MDKTQKFSGFTFLEVLIAITVFSIGVLAILNLVMRNLDTVDKVQLKTSATFLAKEGMEIAYNIRDTNIQKGFEWDCILKSPEDFEIFSEDVCAHYFSEGIEGKIFHLAFDPENYYFTDTAEDTGFENNQLYYSGWYSYDNAGEASNFARYLVFTEVIGQENLDILKIESHVIIQKGSYTHEIVLESFISKF